jgi:hypothetical protein
VATEAEESAARVALILQHGARANIAAAAKLARHPRVRPQSPNVLQSKLEFLALRGWDPHCSARVWQGSLEWLIIRINFAEKHRCDSSVRTRRPCLSTICLLHTAKRCLMSPRCAPLCGGSGNVPAGETHFHAHAGPAGWAACRVSAK